MAYLHTLTDWLERKSVPAFADSTHPVCRAPYACFRLTERNLTFNFIAFCATAPGDRLSLFATAVPDNFAFANCLSVRTSSFDHATIRRLDFDFAFAMHALRKKHAS